MSRVKSHKWDNRTEMRKPGGRYAGWTRRVTWYCESWERRDRDIRLLFEDETGVAHKFYLDDEAAAKRDWDAFKSGELTTQAIRDQRTGNIAESLLEGLRQEED